MTPTVAQPAAASAEARRADRRLDQAWLGGVCAGLAGHLGWPVLVVRLGIVLLAASRLVGVAIYLVLWLVLPRATGPSPAPGLAAATRTGRRGVIGRSAPRADLGVASAVALVGGGLLWLVQSTGLGLPEAVFWPGLIGSAGLMLVWWQADHISSTSIRPTATRVQWVAPLLAHWSSMLNFALGLAASGVAIGLVVVAQPGLGEVSRLFLVVGLSLVVLLLASAPWIIRVRRSLAAARQEKMIADTRADMAAHLHDSVLQTLALIQRQATDPKAVATLARRQERELRAWLYGETADEATLKVALAGAAADVEDVHGVPVELVLVGDGDLTPELTALVGAAREAMVNAARHSGAAKVDVYAEVDAEAVQVFVRDRGCGFDPAAVPSDRLGLRGSIVERLRRVGGNATIRSTPGEGTEVRLEIRR